ncbi:MAG: AmmeMemoRadiSam system protein B, partial [Candidatus Caldatribacteriota bacterium]|nr:AmmeMemoRadiSam system protein B [Candidatus Caldatribacteriota bacterium]
MEKNKIRKAVYSGSFYEDNLDKLNKQIENCFLHEIGPGKLPVTNLAGKSKIIGLISPHAGYIYSGPVASHGFYQLALNGIPDAIIILGPNHRGFGEEISIMSEGSWATPLGELEIDQDLAKIILEHSKIIKEDSKAHQSEHSIEVQIPFIQYIFGNDVKIVPISMSQQDINTDIQVASSICSSIKDKNIVIIASSDFTHYESQEYAKNIDKMAIEAIKAFNPEKLYELIYDRRLTMCGPGPVTVLLITCMTLGANKAELLKYATSGDINGMYEQVVGYASILI